MAQSLAFVLVHVIFSTKDRRPVLDASVLFELHAYLASVARNMKCECYRVGGVADHVHLAVRMSRDVDVASLVQELKTASSQWLKTKSPALRRFAWQRGYGAFSVGPTDLGALGAYIDGQERHHRKVTFQDELRAFLKKYGVEYDERYLWD
ncbi:MAG TPA: IS200/IS605 family transposase [Acidobacteriaceae bacterium]|nr:IS200/IS605 family transposase [Acidobacteriaceae bacterium]